MMIMPSHEIIPKDIIRIILVKNMRDAVFLFRDKNEVIQLPGDAFLEYRVNRSYYFHIDVLLLVFILIDVSIAYL